MSKDSKTIIREAAKKLFSQKGFAATSVRDISSEAGVNVSAINYHFGGKDALLLDIFKTISEKIHQINTNILSPASSLEEMRIKLEIYVGQFLQGSFEDPDAIEMIHRNFEHIADKAPKSLIESIGTMNDKFCSFFSEAQKSGFIRQDIDPILLVQIFLSSLTEIVRKSAIRKKILGFSIQDPKTKDSYIKGVVSIFLEGAKSNEV